MSQGRTPLFRSLIQQLQAAHQANIGWSRRDFIAATAAAIAASALPSHAGHTGSGRRKLDGPVIIVGGGIAGLTAAYTLMKAGVDCEVYEGSQRFGGRMFTKRHFNSEGMFCELGGELVDTNHRQLIRLCHEVGAEIQPLKAGEKGVDFYSVGGHIHRDFDIIPAFQFLASRIAADAKGLTDAKGAYTAKAKALDAVSLRAYLADAGAQTPAWLIKILDVAYVCEYGLDAHQQSALNLVNWISPDTRHGFELFGASDEAWRVRGGSDTLPAAVYGKISSKVKTHPRHELSAIASRGDKVLLTFRHGSETVKLESSHVICAIPFTILRRIEGVKSLQLSPDKKRAIAQMGYGTNMKIMWGVKDRMWRRPGEGSTYFCDGSVVSDLPFQQVWETSRGQKGRSGILTNFIGGSAGAHWTPARLHSFSAEIQKVFPTLAGQWDGNREIMNWPKIKWVKGSYSAPLRGQYTWIYEAAASVELNGALHFAGEHTSSQSAGFMNGGVESGQRAAKEVIEG
ncbi:MAG: NAD(P)/FAD-dependent oxidoreductase [Chthoniobacteraceae bacterium]